MKAIKNIAFSLFTNIWILIVNIGVNFITPYFCSVEDFGKLKTFMLYMSFSGLFHFGFIDGIYLNYAGKEIHEINVKRLSYYKRVYVLIQLCVSLLLLFFSFYLDNEIVLLFGISSFCINLFNFGTFFFQATNRFDVFSKVNFLSNFIVGGGVILLFYVFRVTDYRFVAATLTLSYLIGSLSYEFFYRKLLNKKNRNEKIEDNSITKILKAGGYVLLGNLMFLFITMIDKWTINFFFSSYDFAIYSFAASVIAIITTLISSLSVALFPILVNNYNEVNLSLIKIATLVLSVFGLTVYFFSWILIELYFPKYIQSVEVLKILVLIVPPLAVISVISINFYKINNLLYLYIKDLFVAIIVTVFIYFLSFLFEQSLTNIALASFLSFNFCLWFLNRRNKYLHFEVRDVCYYFFNLLIFCFLCYSSINVFMSLLVYLFICASATYFFYNKAFARLNQMLSLRRNSNG